jgi:hypothetical protein
MAIDASDLLGAQQIAGVTVYPRGATWAAEPGAGGDRPKFKGQALLVLTGDEVALVRVKAGVLSSRPSEVLVRVPRSTVREVNLDDGVVPKLSLSFSDESTWTMDIPRALKKQGDTKRIVELLQGPATGLAV